MNINEIAQKSVDSVAQFYNTSIKSGLSDSEIRARQNIHGLNTLPRKGRSWLHILIEQFSSSFVHLLIIAAVLSFFLQNHINGITIALLTLATTLMGFYQEYYAERTVQLLMHYLETQSLVLRNGKTIKIKSDQLVPGDIIFLSSGNVIPADVRFIQTQSLCVDESTLSGESLPIQKNANFKPDDAKPFTPATIGLCGSTITEGTAVGIIIATGSKTKLSTVATLGSDIDRPSMFSQEISDLSRIIALLVVVTLIVIYLVHLFKSGRSLSTVDISLFMVALAVSIVPQAMQAVITFALSQGARVMARKDVIVKRLASIEDLGSVTVLCVDKTGTITENKLTVDEVFSDNTLETINMAFYTRKTATGEENGASNAFDKALDSYLKLNNNPVNALQEIIHTIPFNPRTRSNGAIISKERAHTLIIRGAYENVIGMCKNTQPKKILELNQWIEQRGNEGKRIIAIAVKNLDSYDPNADYFSYNDMTFHGLIAFADPIKPSVYEALREAQELGVEIKIITGDAPTIARHVAKKIGLISQENQVMTGDEFEQLSRAEQEEACKRVAVFARTLPEQKFNIINTMKRTERVAFLGEGINDVPSLKSSLVGLVVENASDIAKDAADIVLLKKNLLVIVEGIQEGRKIFTNTLTYFQGMLTSNFSRFYAIALASFLIDYLPMLPLQILLVNFLSDLPLIFIATDNVDPEDLEKPRRYQVKELLSFGMILGGLCFVIDLIFFMKFKNEQPSILRTNWFIITVLTEHIFFMLIRAKGFALRAIRPSFILGFLTILSAIATVALPYTRFGQEIFELTPPSTQHLIWMGGFLVFYFIVMEMCKLVYYRFFSYHSEN